jgi:hypothetical protein
MVQKLDYTSQRNIIYMLFGFAYASDEKLVDVVKNFNLYSPNLPLLQNILDSIDIELIALSLYVFGKLAYNRKLKKRLKKR